MSTPKEKPLIDQVGKIVEIEGYAVRSKAGAYLVTDYGNIWLKQSDWTSEENNQKVIVLGLLIKGVDPMSIFPVAKQDESGAWSQGVAPADMYNDFQNYDTERDSSFSKASKTESAWMIEISKVEIIPKQ